MRKAALVGFGDSALLAGLAGGEHGKPLPLAAELDARIGSRAGA